MPGLSVTRLLVPGINILPEVTGGVTMGVTVGVAVAVGEGGGVDVGETVIDDVTVGVTVGVGVTVHVGVTVAVGVTGIAGPSLLTAEPASYPPVALAECSCNVLSSSSIPSNIIFLLVRADCIWFGTTIGALGRASCCLKSCT
jgi:hypothetical protein